MRACWPKRLKEERERERERENEHVRVGERERERTPARWLLFLCFFLPLGLPYVNWASQECCFFCLRSSLWSSDLPLFYFCGLFPSLSFSHCHSGLLFPILTTNNMVAPHIINCLAHFVSVQINKLHAVTVQQRYIKPPDHRKYHSSLDGHHYKASEAWY